MCIINIFRSAYTDELESIKVESGKPIHECIDADLDNSIISVNGFEKDKNYILHDNDLCTIRVFPAANDKQQDAVDWVPTVGLGLLGAAIGLAVGGPLGLFVGGFLGAWSWGFSSSITKDITGKSLTALIMPEMEVPETPEDAKQLPTIRGSQNQSLQGHPIPFIMGKHLLVPYYCGKPYTSISGTDGENQYITILFMLGYSKLKVTDIKLGELLIAANKEGVLDNNNKQRIKIEDSLSSNFYDIELELCQSDRELDLYPQKVYEEQIQIELTNIEGNKIESKRISAQNPHKVQVEISMPCLIAHDNEGKEKAASITLCVMYRWHTLDGSGTWKPFSLFDGRTSNSGNNSVFTRTSNKMMRFTATKTFTYADLPKFVNDDGVEEIVPASMIDLNIFRVSENSIDSMVQDKLYLTAIRTWTYDYRKTQDARSIVIERPVDAIRRKVSSRLAMKIKSSDSVQDTINQLSCVLESYARVWNSNSQTWSTDEVPTRNPAAIAIKALTGNLLGNKQIPYSKIDLQAFGKFYEFCDDIHNDDIPEINELNKRNCIIECNGVVHSQRKLSDLLLSILNVGRATYVRNGELISLVIDKAQSQFVTILNNQNVISANNSKAFAEVPDGVKVSFVDEDCGWQTNTLYLNYDDGSTNIRADSIYKEIQLPYQTHRNQVWHTCMYEQAKAHLRPELWTRTVSTDGNLLGIMNLVQVQDDTIVVGIGDGAEITNFEYDVTGKYITTIVTDGRFNVADLSKEYGLKIIQSDGIHEPLIRVVKVNITEPGLLSSFLLDAPIYINENIVPSIGDIVSFGEYGKETIDAIILSKKPQEDGKFELVIAPYSTNVYEYEKTRVMPEFDSKINAPQAIAGIKELPKNYLSQEDLYGVLFKITNGSESDIPDPPALLTAVANMENIDLNWIKGGIGLKNTVREYVIELSKGSGFVEIARTADTNYKYIYDRRLDGYLEASDFTPWRVRVKVVNIYGKESQGYAGEEAGIPVNTDTYGTWKLSAPKITPQVKDRHITLIFAQPARADGKKVYGNIRNAITIRRPDIDTLPDAWFTPGLSLSPYPETLGDGTEITNELNYKLDTNTPEYREETYVQTMPLKGQGGDGQSIENTLYMFRVVAENEAGSSPATTVQATALCTSIVDLVNANITQKEAYVPDLSAISANLGSINQGSMGNDNNRWDLSTFVDPKGIQRWEGLFHVGGDNQYFHVDPVINDIGQIIDYKIQFKAGQLEVTSETSNIKGEVIIMSDENDYERTRITPTGTYYEYLANEQTGWQMIARQSTAGLLSQILYSNQSLLISNSTIDSRRARGLDIGRVYLSSNTLVYHFDTDLYDQHGTNPVPYTLDGQAHLVDASDNSPLYPIDFTPAILAVAPYSDIGKSAYGQFALTYPLESPEKLAIDFWVQTVWAKNCRIFKYGNDDVTISLISIVIEPYYNVPKENEPPYNYEIEDTDKLPYNVAIKMTSYLDLDRTCTDENTGQTLSESQRLYLEDYGLEIVQNTWVHIGIGKTVDTTVIYINDKAIPITNEEFMPEASYIMIGDKNSIQLDELMVDTTVTLDANEFFTATTDKVPWGTLDYRKKHFLIDADDPDTIQGNFFYGKTFQEAVQRLFFETTFENAVATAINKGVADGRPGLGHVYIQFRGESAPDDLYPGTTWQNITNTYAGRFFRAEGGSANSFGQTQGGGLPNIYGSFAIGAGAYLAENDGAFFNRNGLALYNTGLIPSEGPSGTTFNAGRSNGLYGAASEVRPVNETIRIWKRTK